MKETPIVEKVEVKISEKIYNEEKQEEESEEEIIDDVEAMIECSNFISELMNKDKPYASNKTKDKERKKFEYLMQKEESLNNLNYEENFKEKFLHRKRNLEAKENILKIEKEEIVEDLYNIDWRNQD